MASAAHRSEKGALGTRMGSGITAPRQTSQAAAVGAVPAPQAHPAHEHRRGGGGHRELLGRVDEARCAHARGAAEIAESDQPGEDRPALTPRGQAGEAHVLHDAAAGAVPQSPREIRRQAAEHAPDHVQGDRQGPQAASPFVVDVLPQITLDLRAAGIAQLRPQPAGVEANPRANEREDDVAHPAPPSASPGPRDVATGAASSFRVASARAPAPVTS